jgi:hypothetical protein
VILAVLAIMAAPATLRAVESLTENTMTSQPIGITTGPDGLLWVTAISEKGEDIERIYHGGAGLSPSPLIGH